jgi:hypothetical protein
MTLVQEALPFLVSDFSVLMTLVGVGLDVWPEEGGLLQAGLVGSSSAANGRLLPRLNRRPLVGDGSGVRPVNKYMNIYPIRHNRNARTWSSGADSLRFIGKSNTLYVHTDAFELLRVSPGHITCKPFHQDSVRRVWERLLGHSGETLRGKRRLDTQPAVAFKNVRVRVCIDNKGIGFLINRGTLPKHANEGGVIADSCAVGNRSHLEADQRC